MVCRVDQIRSSIESREADAAASTFPVTQPTPLPRSLRRVMVVVCFHKATKSQGHSVALAEALMR
jgi:hypothetical protein